MNRIVDKLKTAMLVLVLLLTFITIATPFVLPLVKIIIIETNEIRSMLDEPKEPE